MIACDFECLTHQNKILFKNEASTNPAATAARYPSTDGATHADQGLGETQRSSDGMAEKSRTEPKKKEGILSAPAAIHQRSGIIFLPP